MNSKTAISVIIPTLATSERGDYLLRAIECIVNQQGVLGIPIVVVNGSQYSYDLVRKIKKRKEIKFAYREEASMPRALLAGRELVSTPFFSALDDDDTLLPDALQVRLKPMLTVPQTDVVVTSGYIGQYGQETINLKNFSEVRVDPLRSLLNQNWFLSGSGLFRSKTITANFFEGMPKYLEWTYLAFRISLDSKITFLEQPTVIHYTDHWFSIWNSKQCLIGKPQAVKQILKLDLPVDVHRSLRKKLIVYQYSVARLYIKERRYHCACFLFLKMMKYREALDSSIALISKLLKS